MRETDYNVGHTLALEKVLLSSEWTQPLAIGGDSHCPVVSRITGVLRTVGIAFFQVSLLYQRTSWSLDTRERSRYTVAWSERNIEVPLCKLCPLTRWGSALFYSFVEIRLQYTKKKIQE